SHTPAFRIVTCEDRSGGKLADNSDRQFEQLVLSCCRVLAPRFRHYDEAARIKHSSASFRVGLAVAVAKFFVLARRPKVAQQRRELGKRKRAATLRTKRARVTAHQWADSLELRDAALQE